MADVRILNMMKRGFTLNIINEDANGGRLIKPIAIAAGAAVTVNKDKFDKAKKGNKALQALIHQKRLVVGNAAGTISTPHESELLKKSGDAERPDVLKDTKEAEKKDGKVKHKVSKVETVEVEQASSDKPAGGKRDS